jgi:hypothetical protein
VSYEISRRIEFQNGRSRNATTGRRIEYSPLLVVAERIGPSMHDPDVIATIDGHACDRTQNPVIRQRPGPKRIDLEPRRLMAAPLSECSLFDHTQTCSKQKDERY